MRGAWLISMLINRPMANTPFRRTISAVFAVNAKGAGPNAMVKSPASEPGVLYDFGAVL
jgi:hypothetical protein